jgi:hypothetical protein
MEETLLTVGIVMVLYFLLRKEERGTIETTTINYQISTS